MVRLFYSGPSLVSNFEGYKFNSHVHFSFCCNFTFFMQWILAFCQSFPISDSRLGVDSAISISGMSSGFHVRDARIHCFLSLFFLFLWHLLIIIDSAQLFTFLKIYIFAASWSLEKELWLETTRTHASIRICSSNAKILML